MLLFTECQDEDEFFCAKNKHKCGQNDVKKKCESTCNACPKIW